MLKEWSAFCELGGRSRSSLNEHVEQGAGVPVLLQRLVRFSHRFDPGVHEGPEGTTAWELPTVMRGRRVVDWATLGGDKPALLDALSKSWEAVLVTACARYEPPRRGLLSHRTYVPPERIGLPLARPIVHPPPGASGGEEYCTRIEDVWRR